MRRNWQGPVAPRLGRPRARGRGWRPVVVTIPEWRNRSWPL